MAYLNQLGTISYNGYQFQGPRNSVQLEMENVRDASGRYVTHTLFRFSIDTWITSNTSGTEGDGTDASSHMQTIRAALSTDGGELTITGFGYGDITANTGESDRDVNFGPKVTLMKMRNIGSGCIVLMWSVEVALKVCSGGSAVGETGKIKEYVYAVRWAIKPNGCTTRIVEGHLEIFNNRSAAGQLTVNETADTYRDFIYVEIPEGFLRSQPQEYALSENKQRLEFRVVDEEQLSDNAYPPGVAAMDMEHTISSDLFTSGFISQMGTFQGWIEMAKPYPASLGWSRAILLMQERLVHAVNNDASPMITEISVTESIFRRRVSFNVRYRLLTSSLSKLIDASGLFTDVQSTNLATYRQSMEIAWSYRGAARLQHDPTSDKMVDACSGNQILAIKDRVSRYFLNGSTGAIYLVCPPKNASYLVYENFIDFEGASTNIDIQQMPTSTSQSATQGVGKLLGAETLAGNNFAPRMQKIQKAGDSQPKLRVVVRGRAYRVGYYPDAPQVSQLFGKTAGYVAKDSHSTTTQVGFYGDCPIYATTWYNSYDVQFNSQSEMDAAVSSGVANPYYGDDPKTKAKKM